ncbi:MAG: DNA polymerase I [Armatimonadetes bacterium]|nr:DNA polymerase I [Armatimonadota bacterium]
MTKEPRKEPKKLVLIDGNSLIYRAFFALPPLTNAAGEVTNAAYGFTTMLYKVLDEVQPEMAAVAFDLRGPTFRHELYEEYKATRREMPDELAPQFDMVRELLEAMHIPTYGVQGYEADDVIGTLSQAAEQRRYDVVVVTGDLDELQLVSEHVSVMVTRRGITETQTYDEKAVKERYGLEPRQLADFRALTGDTSDNIPGVPGVGEKTARKLIGEYGSLEHLLGQLDEVKPPRIASALEAHADVARRAKELSLIVRDLDLEFEPDKLRRVDPDEDKLVELFRRLDFRSLLKRVEVQPELVAEQHQLATSVDQTTTLAARLRDADTVGLCVLAEDGPAFRAQVHALCLTTESGPTVVVADEDELPALVASLKPVLESVHVKKIGHDLKRASLLLRRYGLVLRGLHFDTMLAAHLVNPSRRAEDLPAVLSDYLGVEVRPAFVNGKSDLEAVAATTGQMIPVAAVLSEQLEQLELTSLFRDLEMPLIPVLAEMEHTGIALNCEVLDTLSSQLGERTSELEKDIHSLAGEEFNIGSPAQLRRVLFEKLGLPPDKTKKTKSGYSTAADVLAGLAEYEIVAKILEYREVTKLKSTYVDALPPLVNPDTGRLHTSFNQAVTATGRLSSTNPNLQNIPIRTEAGMQIRRAFVAGEPNQMLLSADYSQIELRILAHITGDEHLTEIFLSDEDLHRATAAEVFGLEPERVTAAQRSFAKMINFGIPYGMSDFRLARELKISLEDARGYLQRYFERFPRVHDYVMEMPAKARELGYVQTLMGRRRPLPELRTRSAPVRQAAERMAINTPMQGSAADIIKRAMLVLADRLSEGGLSAKMLLQVHDELVLEVREDQLEKTGRVLVECMSRAYDLSVPLKVDLKAGRNWLEMEPV